METEKSLESGNAAATGPAGEHEPLPRAGVRLRLVGGCTGEGREAPVPAPGNRLALMQEAEGRELLADFSRSRDLVTYVSGFPGVGKSTLLLHLILADIATGHACVVIDPHGDLVKDVARLLPHDPSACDRVVLFDPADTQWPLGLDLLDARTEAAQDLVVQFMVELFEELFLPEHQGPMLHQSLSNGLRLLMETGGCLAELPVILPSPVPTRGSIVFCGSDERCPDARGFRSTGTRPPGCCWAGHQADRWLCCQAETGAYPATATGSAAGEGMHDPWTAAAMMGR